MLRVVWVLRREWLVMGMLLLLLLLSSEFVEWTEVLGAIVLRILDVRPVNASLCMALGLWSIIDIRIVPIVAGLIARHAWILPQRAALADRREQENYVLKHFKDVL